MGAVEKQLVGSRGKYSFGDEVSIADIFVYATVEGAISKFGTDFSMYPNIVEVHANLGKLESFERSKAIYCVDFHPH